MKLLRNTMMEVGVPCYHDNALFDGLGINLEISVVDLSTGEVGPAVVRGEKGWTVGELKQHIGEVRGRIYCHLYCSPSLLPLVCFLVI